MVLVAERRHPCSLDDDRRRHLMAHPCEQKLFVARLEVGFENLDSGLTAAFTARDSIAIKNHLLSTNFDSEDILSSPSDSHIGRVVGVSIKATNCSIAAFNLETHHGNVATTTKIIDFSPFFAIIVVFAV